MTFRPATQIESRPNFSSLLDECPSEVKFAPPIPQGSYVAIVQPQWRKDVNNKGNEFHEFSFKLFQAFEDVDEDELKEWTENHGDIGQRPLKRKFFVTHDALPYLDEFHEACGINLQEAASKKMSRLLRNDEVGNSYVGVYIKHRLFNDGSGKKAVEVDRFFRVTE